MVSENNKCLFHFYPEFHYVLLPNYDNDMECKIIICFI